MKKLSMRGAVLLLALVLLSGTAFAVGTLVPVGQTIGIEVDARGLTVVGFENEAVSREAGLQAGDMIIKADGQPVKTAQQLRALAERARGSLVLTLLRDGGEETVTVPLQAGSKKLGVYIREGITGIGTVTYYDPTTGSFGALGHGVTGGNGRLVPMEAGTALEAGVAEIQKGKAGTPGQLRGAFQQNKALGTLEKNTSCGIFGHSPTGWAGSPLPVGSADQVHTGKAVLLSNLRGKGVQEYDVEIVRLYPNQGTPGRNMLLKVTDSRLLETTGGIVQGMSGSPLVQDGKLIGAVTHVLVNDPTMGYGIFIENMLEAAG